MYAGLETVISAMVPMFEEVNVVPKGLDPTPWHVEINRYHMPPHTGAYQASPVQSVK